MATQRKKRARTSSRDGTLRRLGHRITGHGPWWLATIRWIAFLGVVGIVFSAATFFILYRSISIPDANADFETQTTKVYYSDGKHKLGEFAQQDRENVPLEDIPASMEAAAIAAEDRTFYSNRGIDIKGIIRAARDNAQSGEIQGGGSTITQQYVKILYLTQERSYSRKIKEAILSIKIHNQRSKKEILEGYLNTIYFGNGAYGVQVASQTYFDKPAKDLDYAESAILATIINSPSYYDPYAEGAEDRIGPRFRYVLDGMVKSGAITAEEAARFDDRLPKFADKPDVNRFSGSKGYLLDLVRRKMGDLEFTDQQIQGGGLRIVTTFDYERQRAAVKAIKTHRPEGAKQLHQALVSIKPGTGAVQAMYAGRDYLKNQVNWATNGTQPGSTFKVFSVIAALEDGYSLKTQLNGSSPLMIDGKMATENQGDSGGQSFGRIPLEFATQKSVNTAFVDLMDQMEDGPTKTLEAAEAAGVPASIISRVKDSDGGPPLVTPLGYFPVAPVDMANAYATLAAGGKKADWFVIQSVKDAQGDTVHRHETEVEQSIPKDVAADTVWAMQKVVNSGAAGTGSNGRTMCPTAGKTGTATAGADDDQRVSSSWFAGFTPKLATAVMYNRGKLGNGDLEGYMIPFFGGQIPAMTFQTYMNSALQGTECGTFPPPANLQGKKGKVYVPPANPKPKPEPKPKPSKKPEPEPTRTTEEPEPEPTTTRPPNADEGSNGSGKGRGGRDNGLLLLLPLMGLAGLRRLDVNEDD